MTPTPIEIDGARYIIGRMAPRKALKLQNRLIRVLGPALVPMLRGVELGDNGKPSISDVDLSAAGEAIQGLMAQLTPEEQDSIMEQLFSTVQVVSADKAGPLMPIFDAHFDGRLLAVWKLMWACLEEQFGGFFGLLGAAARSMLVGRRSVASTTSSPSGPSGASS